MKRVIIISILFLMMREIVCAQGLKIGDKMPALEIGPMMNYPEARVNISEWKGKLLILDFWSVNCGSCIAGFPNLEKLQEKFDTSIQIVLVSKESRDSLMRFFRKKKRIRIPCLPMLSSDSVLKNLFPHVYMPHQVWIDGDGKVRYITDGYNATEDHVRKFLAGSAPAMSEKKYEKEFQINDPASLLANEKWTDKLTYYSLIMHTASGVSVGTGTGNTTGKGKPNRITANGHSAVQLFAKAYAAGNKYNFSSVNTIILEAKDPFPYQRPKDSSLMNEWVEKYCYNYVLQVPVENGDELYPTMQEELCRYFKLNGTIEKRKVKCLVLTRTDSGDKLASKRTATKTNLWSRTTDSIRYIYNQPFHSLTMKIKGIVNSNSMRPPFIDATGYKGNIDMEISTDAIDYLDIPFLAKQLLRYGLELKEREWETDVLVLREK